MMPTAISVLRCVIGIILITGLLTGCASNQSYRNGLALIERGSYEDGLQLLSKAVEENPREPRYRATLLQKRDQIISRELALAGQAIGRSDAQSAESHYHRVLAVQPQNQRAVDGLRVIERWRSLPQEIDIAAMAIANGDIDRAEKHVMSVLAIDHQNRAAIGLQKDIELARSNLLGLTQQIRSQSSTPINLEFRDAYIKQIFEALSKATGVNFILDRDIKPDLRASIFVRNVSLDDALNILLIQNQLDRKVMSENTVIIFPATQSKLKDYQELVIRTFVLANTEVRQAITLLKTMLRVKEVYSDEKLNAVTIRDTPEVIRLAEKLLAVHDVSEPEVTIELEVLEVSQKRILDLGVQWPSTFTALNSDLGAIALLNQLKGIDSNRIGVNGGPVARVNATDSAINTLANPVIRVRSKEKAKIHVGDKIPIVSATSTPSTQGPVTTENITYLDVGLKIEVEPTVYSNDEVGIRISMEVSNSTSRGTTASGSTLVEVSTRNASTGLRLRDGETQILAGLLRNDSSNSGSRIPGFGDIPVLGRLFGASQDTTSKTELVLSIRPKIVRNVPVLSPVHMEFPSGTESTIRTTGHRARLLKESATASKAQPDKGSGAQAERPRATAQLGVKETAAPDIASGSTIVMWSRDPKLKIGENTQIALHIATLQPLSNVSILIGYEPAAIRIIESQHGAQVAAATFSVAAERDGLLRVGTSALPASAPGASAEVAVLGIQGLTDKLPPHLEVRSITGTAADGKIVTIPFPITQAFSNSH